MGLARSSATMVPHVKPGDRDLADDFDPVTELHKNKADLDPEEQPTLDHVKPHSVADNWQREGHKSAYIRTQTQAD